FLLLAAEQRNALAVLAYSRQRVAVLGFRLVLALRNLDKTPADEHHGAAGDDRVDHRGDHQKARNGDAHPAELKGQRAADGPSTTTNVMADSTADTMPEANSTGDSVAMRRS